MNTTLKSAIRSSILGRNLSMQEKEALLDHLSNVVEDGRVTQILVDKGLTPPQIRDTSYPEPNVRLPFPARVLHEAVQIFVNHNHRLNAIRMIRSVTGFGLKDAKDYLDRYYPL